MIKIKPFLLIHFRNSLLSFNRDHFFFYIALKIFTVFHFYSLFGAFVRSLQTFFERNVSYISIREKLSTTDFYLFIRLSSDKDNENSALTPILSTI